MIGMGSQIGNAANFHRSMGGFDSVTLWYDMYPAPNEYMATAIYENGLNVLSIANRKNNADILNSVGDSNGWIENGCLFLQSNSQPIYRSNTLPCFNYLQDGTIYLVMRFDPLHLFNSELLYITNNPAIGDCWIKAAVFLDGSDLFWRFSARDAGQPENYFITSEFQVPLHNGFVFLKMHRNSSLPFIQIYDFLTGIETPGLETGAGAGGVDYVFSFAGGYNFLYECIFEAGIPQAESVITNYLIQKYSPLL